MKYHNKIHIVLLGIHSFFFFLATSASAIPSNDPHPHKPGDVTWSEKPIPPNDPDSTNHQHNSNLNLLLNSSYDTYAAWDSETLFSGPRDTWRFPVGTGNEGSATTYGHGFIADDFISAIEYSFVGAGWNDENKGLVNAAFQEWEKEAKTRPHGSMVGQGGKLVRRPGTIVGINFDEDTFFTQTNFEIRFDLIPDGFGGFDGNETAAQWFPDDSPADPDPFDLELVFNSNAIFNNSGMNTSWDSLPEGPVGAITSEWDFYSVALHEIGHILGLDHVDVGDGSNLMASGSKSFNRGEIHRFIDTSDLQGAIDLYSIPVSEPTSTLSLLALGTLGAVSTLKRKLKPSKKDETKVS